MGVGRVINSEDSGLAKLLVEGTELVKIELQIVFRIDSISKRLMDSIGSSWTIRGA